MAVTTGGAPDIEWVGARDAAQTPTVLRTAPQRMIQTQMSMGVVPVAWGQVCRQVSWLGEGCRRKGLGSQSGIAARTGDV